MKLSPYHDRWRGLRASLVAAMMLFSCLSLSAVAVSDESAVVLLHLKWHHGFQFAGYYAAREQGFYRDEGLDVTILEATPTRDPVEEVLTGTARYGVSGAGLLTSRLAGDPVVAVASIFQHSPYIMMTRLDRGFTTPTDLVGARVMFSAQRKGLEFEAMFRHAGVDMTTLDILPHSWDISDLIDGRVDAIAGYITDEPHLMRMRGVEPGIIRPVDYGVDFYGDSLFTSEDEAKHHPRRVEAFRRASLAGWYYALAHVEETLQSVLNLPGVKERGITIEHLRYEAEQTEKLIQPDLIEIGYMNPARWANMVKIHMELGLIDREYPLDDFLYRPEASSGRYWIYALLASVAGLAVVAMVAWLWNRQLYRAVAHATEELRESEAHYRTLFETAAQGVLVADLATKQFMYANPAICRMLGYTADEVTAMGVTDIHPPAELPGVIAEFEAQARGEKPTALNIPCLRKDGSVFYADVVASVITMGGRTCNAGFFTDISERKKTELEKERLMSAIEQAAETIVITDAEGMVLYANPAFEHVTGYTRQEILGQNPSILKSGEHDVPFYDRMWDTLTRGETWVGRLVNKRKNGEVYTEDATISPVRDGSGTIVNYVAVKRDMSREIELEEQLHQSQKMEAIGLLAGGVAHDFNNLLQAILGYTAMILSDTTLSSEHRGDLQHVHTAADRAATLTRQLLTFSRRQVIQPMQINLNHAIDNFMQMLRRVIGEDIELDIAPGHGLWTVLADQSQIELVLMNLCFNSRDAMPDGGTLTIKTGNRVLDEAYCRQYPWARQGRFVLLSVSDTGCGMDKHTLQQAFDPFFTTKGVGKGTGLGLSMVYGIVQQHEGIIHADSHPDSGTTFQIFLPATERSAAKPESGSTMVPHGGTETILVAEDEDTVRTLSTRMLECAGYRVLEACDGQDALRVLDEQSGKVDLALLDVVMPKLGGRATAQRINDTYSDVKILFMSGYSQNALDTSLLADTGLQLIEKPYELDELLAKVRQVLDS